MLCILIIKLLLCNCIHKIYYARYSEGAVGRLGNKGIIIITHNMYVCLVLGPFLRCNLPVLTNRQTAGLNGNRRNH